MFRFKVVVLHQHHVVVVVVAAVVIVVLNRYHVAASANKEIILLTDNFSEKTFNCPMLCPNPGACITRCLVVAACACLEQY